jgi:hypothetical protein
MPGPNAAKAGEADREVVRLAEICIEAHALIERTGTPEMKLLVEELLFRIGVTLAGGLRRAPNLS